MKKIYLLLAIPLSMMACQSKPTTGETAAKTDSTKQELAYKIKKDYNWQAEPNRITLPVALDLIKSFEVNDTTAMAKLVGDSVVALLDGFDFKGSRSQFLVGIKEEIDKFKEISIEMEDWETMKAADGSEEWVELWYKQKWVDTKGKADSVHFHNDIQVKDGKVVKFMEFSRHYPAQK